MNVYALEERPFGVDMFYSLETTSNDGLCSSNLVHKLKQRKRYKHYYGKMKLTSPKFAPLDY